MANYVFLALSLDGFMADKDHGVGWLDTYVKAEKGNDMGYAAHMARVDALLMGRNTVEFVLNAGVDWPYTKPVFVLSHTWTAVPKGFEDKIFLIKGEPKAVVAELAEKGYKHLYIDGGVLITEFLKQDLVDEMIITTVPVVLGGGIPLFGQIAEPVLFNHVKTTRFNETVVQNHYLRAK